jgi:hypothetical protein
VARVRKSDQGDDDAGEGPKTTKSAVFFFLMYNGR